MRSLLERDPKLTDERSAQRIAELDAKVRTTLEQARATCRKRSICRRKSTSTQTNCVRRPATSNTAVRSTFLSSSHQTGPSSCTNGFAAVRKSCRARSWLTTFGKSPTHVEAVARLQDDPDALELFGARWRGYDTNLEPAVAVSQWGQAASARDLAGVGKGHEELRDVLLHGDPENSG